MSIILSLFNEFKVFNDCELKINILKYENSLREFKPFPTTLS